MHSEELPALVRSLLSRVWRDTASTIERSTSSRRTSWLSSTRARNSSIDRQPAASTVVRHDDRPVSMPRSNQKTLQPTGSPLRAAHSATFIPR